MGYNDDVSILFLSIKYLFISAIIFGLIFLVADVDYNVFLHGLLEILKKVDYRKVGKVTFFFFVILGSFGVYRFIYNKKTYTVRREIEIFYDLQQHIYYNHHKLSEEVKERFSPASKVIFFGDDGSKIPVDKTVESTNKERAYRLIETLDNIKYILRNVSVDDEYFSSFSKILNLYSSELKTIKYMFYSETMVENFLNDSESLAFFIDKFDTLQRDLHKVKTISTKMKYKELTSFIVYKKE